MRSRIAILAIVLGSLWLPRGTAAQAPPPPPENLVVVTPARRAPDAPPPLPPDLPASVGSIEPVTFAVRVQQQSGAGKIRTTEQTVSRTRDRVHMTIGRREWLFEQNPIDPRRVSAWLVDHDTRVIVLHEESDIRNALGLNGWANVLTLGFDPAAVGGLRLTGKSLAIGGSRFRHYAAPDTKQGIAEAWWNEDLLLAAAFVLRDSARTRVTIDRLRPGVDAQLLRAPALRFTSYKVVDRAEWLEGR